LIAAVIPNARDRHPAAILQLAVRMPRMLWHRFEYAPDFFGCCAAARAMQARAANSMCRRNTNCTTMWRAPVTE